MFCKCLQIVNLVVLLFLLLADPIITAAANKIEDGVLLIVTVGDRGTYVITLPMKP